MKEPCKDCPDIQLDTYGYLCDLSCGKRTAWLNHQVGIKEAMKWIESHQLIEPDKDSITRFEPFYQIEQRELKELGLKDE